MARAGLGKLAPAAGESLPDPSGSVDRVRALAEAGQSLRSIAREIGGVSHETIRAALRRAPIAPESAHTGDSGHL